ncbi:hypothetical protein EA14781_089_00010 [Escherichia albertii NBRC 107761 = DSM 17582]|nr:hypothetical protein EA14781_089_00010 [Escherichia albertii NBRC 107761 = DSM 17582]
MRRFDPLFRLFTYYTLEVVHDCPWTTVNVQVRAMKSLSKSSQIPLYQQVVEWIRESIYTGDLVEDDRIPSEYQVMLPTY